MCKSFVILSFEIKGQSRGGMQVNYQELYQQTSVKIANIFNRYGVEPSEFLNSVGCFNREIHGEILKVMAEIDAPLGGNFDNYMDFIRQGSEPWFFENEEEGHIASPVIRRYVECFYRHCYTVQDGKVVLTNLDNFALPYIAGPNDVEELVVNYASISARLGNRHQNPHKRFEVLILPSGKCYIERFNLAIIPRWLTACGVNLHDGIVLRCQSDKNELKISTLYERRFSAESYRDKAVSLTEPQGIILNTLYNTLQHGLGLATPMKNYLRQSSGLGLSINDFDETLAMNNLTQIVQSNGDIDAVKYYDELAAEYEEVPVMK